VPWFEGGLACGLYVGVEVGDEGVKVLVIVGWLVGGDELFEDLLPVILEFGVDIVVRLRACCCWSGGHSLTLSVNF
jgi:hypothetical protein